MDFQSPIQRILDIGQTEIVFLVGLTMLTKIKIKPPGLYTYCDKDTDRQDENPVPQLKYQPR